MSRYYARFVSIAALALITLPSIGAFAQQQVPPAPAEPSAPAPAAAPTFPAPDPKNFTATTPTKEEVNNFLQASWGYDHDRVWQVQAILKTQAEGVNKVVIYIGDKTGKQKPSAFMFFVLPGGKFIVAGEDVFPFGEHPYAANRVKLQQRATGPYRGAATKDFELVEFADFQCPHCKEAQANMEKLATDFPKARIVFENYPLENPHPQAKKAAEYGVCVAKLGGSTAFFKFADATFEGQDGLSTPDGATLTLNSAVTKAGLDPAKVAACVDLPATSADVDASVKFAQELNINQTPVLMVNGRQVPVGGVPYETLKQIVEYQAKMDGITQ